MCFARIETVSVSLVQVSRQTRVEVVTEGLFIRRILEDPELKVKMLI